MSQSSNHPSTTKTETETTQITITWKLHIANTWALFENTKILPISKIYEFKQKFENTPKLTTKINCKVYERKVQLKSNLIQIANNLDKWQNQWKNSAFGTQVCGLI